MMREYPFCFGSILPDKQPHPEPFRIHRIPIPPSVFLFKEKITLRSVLGAFVALAGVAFLFLWG
jgi:hypothetical protein